MVSLASPLNILKETHKFKAPIWQPGLLTPFRLRMVPATVNAAKQVASSPRVEAWIGNVRCGAERRMEVVLSQKGRHGVRTFSFNFFMFVIVLFGMFVFLVVSEFQILLYVLTFGFGNCLGAV